MSGFYRFPAMAGMEEYDALDQIEHIREEVDEAILARQDRERQSYGMELLDVIHAAETALRMEFGDAEVCRLRERVIEKNSKRGYYGRDEK